MSIEELIGQRFSRLTVVSIVKAAGRKRLKCVCDCGNEKNVYVFNLKSGGTKSCGCLKKEIDKNAIKSTKHGMTKTPLHRKWCRLSCSGILCEEWKEFEVFFKFISNYDHKGCDISRIDKSKHYSPSNTIICSRSISSTGKPGLVGKTSKYKGVSSVKNGKWVAGITLKGVKYHLGTFDIESDAAIAYDKKAFELNPDTAYLNFPHGYRDTSK